MKKTIVICCVAIAAFNANAQFRATMVNTVRGNERIYTVYADEDMYRYEFEEQGESGIVIVRPHENKTAILMPDKKYVHFTTCDGPMSRMNDPWQSFLWFSSYGEEKTEGTDEVNGYPVLVKAAYQNDSKVFTCYFSEKLHFPVKIVNHMDNSTHMYLKDIQPWETDPVMFEIPPDYTEVDHTMRPVIPEPPAPESWTESAVSIPVAMDVDRGMRIRANISQPDNYKCKFVNKSSSPAKITYHLYEDGEKLTWEEQGKDKYRTYRLFEGESKNLTLNLESAQSILIEVYEGTVQVGIEPE